MTWAGITYSTGVLARNGQRYFRRSPGVTLDVDESLYWNYDEDLLFDTDDNE